MQFEGTFWLLWEDEPIDLDDTRLFTFRDGAIFDGRTGEPRGTYAEAAHGIDALFSERHGEQEVVQFRMSPIHKQWGNKFLPIDRQFDPEADSYPLTFSNARYEAYVATRPANDFGSDEEQDERREWEIDEFGIVPTFGYAYRDCAEVREIGQRNRREFEAEQKRAAFHSVTATA